MATSNRAPELIQRGFQVSIFTWNEPRTATVDAEVYIRAIDGLFYHIIDHGRARHRTLSQLCHDTYRHGFYSHRPYSVMQAADLSCTYCVLALMLSLVETRRLDLAALFRQVGHLRNRRLLPCQEWVLQATWEGVVYPLGWSKREIDGLKESLCELRLPSLVSELERQLSA